MKLFISYARVDRPFCEQIVRTLETAHEVWYDHRLHAGRRWWDQILHRLDWCEGFVYLLSPESVASEYCQKEYTIARGSGKLIFPVKIQSNTQVPEELLETQLVDFSEGLTPQAVAELMAGINVAEVEQVRRPIAPAEAPVEAPVIQLSEGAAVFAAALDAYNAGRLDEALFKLLQVRESGYDLGRFVNLDEVIAEVQAALERQAHLREAERHYGPIARMVAVPALRARGCQAFEKFRQEFPDYDPQNIAGQCAQLFQQQELKQRVDNLLAEAHTALKARRFKAAETALAQANELAPGDPRIAALAGQVQDARAKASAVAREREEREKAKAAASAARARQTYTRKPFEPEMVLIPAGPFLMGSPKSDELRESDEPEQFELLIDYDYAIGKYPVTVGQYRAFIEAGGYKNEAYWTRAGWSWRKSENRTQPRYWTDKERAGNDDLPVVGVSWYEAYAYTCWLAEATGRNYRLPTEAEWEKAGRGGLMIPDGQGGMKKNPNPARIWPWGDEEPTAELCNFDSNYQGGRTSPVFSHAAQARRQPYGLYHMAGNVWDWCLSAYADPYRHPEDNDPEGDPRRVLRGGSWLDDLQSCRLSFRDNWLPDDWFGLLGFRCSLSY